MKTIRTKLLISPVWIDLGLKKAFPARSQTQHFNGKKQWHPIILMKYLRKSLQIIINVKIDCQVFLHSVIISEYINIFFKSLLKPLLMCDTNSAIVT